MVEGYEIKCPLINICNKRIDLDTFTTYCCGKYRECPTFKDKSQTNKYPHEWASIILKGKFLDEKDIKL